MAIGKPIRVDCYFAFLSDYFAFLSDYFALLSDYFALRKTAVTLYANF